MAIKIIKPGKKPDTMRRFECTNCGCVFTADEADYAVFDNYTTTDYKATCPTCHRPVYSSDR
uniref:Transcription initiation factor IIE, alpha FINGER, Transcription n=1 Tax=Siphoviridae sp. ctTDf8 TaxID=2825517 RepID=A0A8S5UJG7_9CAUD|nr:MAG TPA: Transcription initiation factor IIE, alpha FINGER, Transcription [Siphoviridae sp. ctTDf8]